MRNIPPPPRFMGSISAHAGSDRPFPFWAWLCLLLSLAAAAQAQPADQAEFARQAAVEYQLTRTQYQSATNGSPAAWQFARACYNLADFATNDAARADLALQGIESCRKLIKEAPQSGPAHYYLGMNLGQLARTELLGALTLVREMETEFKTAWGLDQQVDHAGAARSLGLLYRDAPGWPASLGSQRKAQEWLDRAAHASPDFPENLLVLIESHLLWDEPVPAGEKLKELDLLWPHARTNFTGQVWEPDWADWTARRLAAEKKLAAQAASPARTSRHG